MNPLQTLRSMRPTLLLMSGRAVGFVATFAIPAVLSRALDPGEFGTYRLLFLIYATLLGLAQMGMAESLYYFLPQRPELAGRWVGNAVVTLAGIGLAVMVAVAATASTVAPWFNNPALAEFLPRIGVFLGLMLASTSLEIVIVCRRKYRQAAVVYGITDVARAASLAIPALVAGSLSALVNGALAFATVRCVLAVVYLRRTFGTGFGLDFGLWKEQLAYALPLTAYVTLEYTQMNFHQYTVAHWFTPAVFAIYSVGCLQIPIVDLLANSAGNVMMVSISDRGAAGTSALRLWHETVERLAFVFLPLVAVLELLAGDVFAVLFPGYAQAVPIFMVSVLMLVLPAFQVDAMLRAHAKTRTLVALSVLRLAIIVGSIGWFVSTFGLKGAVLVTLVAAVVARAAGIVCVARVLGTPLRLALPWGSLAGLCAAAAVAAVPAWLVRTHWNASPLVSILTVGSVYGLAYLAVVSTASFLLAGSRPAAEANAA